MSIEIQTIASTMLNKALDVSMRNHEVISNNIANVNTAGFSPLKLDFDSIMNALDSSSKSSSSDAIRDIKALEIDQFIVADSTQQTVLLEQQMTELAKNTLHYQSLIDAKKMLGSFVKTAISGEIR